MASLEGQQRVLMQPSHCLADRSGTTCAPLRRALVVTDPRPELPPLDQGWLVRAASVPAPMRRRSIR